MSEAGREDERADPVSRILLLIAPALVLLVAAFTPTGSLFPDQRDIGFYYDYAREILAGAVPYLDVPIEYPPGALIAMIVPYLAGFASDVSPDAYKVLFAAWEAALLLVLGIIVGSIGARLGERRWPSIRLIALSAGAILALTWRYDLLPAVLAMLAVLAALERRPILVGVALGLGVLAKLYPVALLPALALPWLRPLDLRGLTRLGASFGLTVGLGLLPFVALAGDAAFGFVSYQVGRGLQIESVGGGLAVLVGLVAGEAPDLSFGFHAVHVEGELADRLLGLLPGVTVVVFALLAWLGWRRVQREVPDRSPSAGIRDSTLVALAFASLLLVLVTSKVYSIQYIVWILPFLALCRGRQFWLGLVIAALTMPIHPMLYGDLIKQEQLPILVLNLRNALVIVVTAGVLIDLARGGARDPREPGMEGNKETGALGETRTHDL